MQNTELLLKELTLEEKCALLSGAETFKTRGMPEHGIPQIWLSDGPHGLRKQAGESDHLGLNPSVPATCFPTASAVANSWDAALGEEIGAALGEEAAAQEVSVVLGPGLNMKRNPLCGRSFEYFSEDPYLAGKLAAGYIRGIQSKGVAACPKHFAVNSQETRRMASDSIVDERTLREIYLTGFEIAVKEGHPRSIMSSYNLVNGTYANENKHLLMEILRGEWGFDGAVITDWGGSNDHALGVKNGSTLEMPAPGGDSVRELLAAVESGKISESDIDARLSELLPLVFDTKAALDAAPREFDAAAHHALARRAAEESLVLLKNEGSLLPLAAGSKVAVIGDFAKNPRYQGAGSSMVNSTQVDVLLDMDRESITDLNALAQVTEDFSDEDIRKLGAVVTMARPRTAEQVKNLVENLDLFDFAPDAHTLEEYGKYMIRQSGHFDYDENLDDFYDYEKYGFQRMNEEDGMFTDRGYIAYKGYSSLREIMNGDQSSHMKMGDMT